MWEFFRFDLKFQLRSPLLWLGALFFALLAFGATSSDSVQIGGAIGNVHRNAPYVIVTFLSVFTILGMFVITAFVAGALLRDHELGTAELFFATPMRKRDYLFGRFGAGILASTAIFVVIALGMMLGSAMPWIDPQRLGPFSLAPYLWAFAVMVIPNLLFIGALLSLLAATTRSMLMVYIGIIAFLVLWVVAGNLIRELDNEWLAALIDPFGNRAMGLATRYWSADERNTRLPELTGYLLANRLLWLGLAGALLAATLALFKPLRAGTGRRWFGRGKATADAAVASAPIGKLIVPAFAQDFSGRAQLAQFWRQLRLDTVGVLKSVPFLVMLAFGMLNLIGGVTFIDSLYGTKVYPVTHLMLQAIQGSYTFLLVLIVVFYAGELVWKERAARLGEVIDATPMPNWVPLAAKFVALAAVVFVFMSAGVLTAMGYQVFKGYARLQPDVYLSGMALESIPFILMAGLALVLQVLSNNKFVGYLLMIGVLVLQLVLGTLDFDHNLYNFAGMPAAPYSDMNGYGHFLAGRLWFGAYWSLFTLFGLALAAAFWLRGISPGWRGRAREARRRLRGPLAWSAASALLAFVAVGGFVFYNTNVVNRYVPGDLALDRRADYENNYRQYKDLPQPRIVAANAEVDIHPERRAVDIRGHYRLVNRHPTAIGNIHVQLDTDVELIDLDMGPATLEQFDETAGYRIYALETPMAPGAELDFDFTLRVAYQGFTNSGEATTLHGNGTFFNNGQLFPGFGYGQSYQIVDRNERRKRDLGEAPRMARLEDESARASTYLSDDADWIDFETTVSTSADQIALAPGYLQREWTENGRRYFHYKMDAPMLPFWAYLSARWEVVRDRWNDVAIEIYHDPQHPYNVDRMIEGVKKSLDYFSANFSPYQHRQMRIIEFPRYASFAQAFANTVPFSESIGFIADLRDKDAIDYVFYVTAHEVAHQWWAHQLIGANVQGATVLSESLAQYSALLVMEKEYGRDKMRRFLKYELDSYLRSRGGELVEELPLYRVENQPYIHYRKGSLVFYRLREEIGEDAVNRALSRFVHDKGFQRPPYTTSAELLDYLRAEAPADKQGLVTDLFEKIAFYDNRVVEAEASRRDDGRYDVRMKLSAGKRYADGLGKETPAIIDDDIEIAVFARARGAEESGEKVLFLERRRITESELEVTAVVDEAPYEVGFDPYNKLIDRVSSDNRKRVSVLTN